MCLKAFYAAKFVVIDKKVLESQYSIVYFWETLKHMPFPEILMHFHSSFYSTIHVEENQSTTNLLRIGSMIFQSVEFETINQLHKHKDFIYVEAKNQISFQNSLITFQNSSGIEIKSAKSVDFDQCHLNQMSKFSVRIKADFVTINNCTLNRSLENSLKGIVSESKLRLKNVLLKNPSKGSMSVLFPYIVKKMKIEDCYCGDKEGRNDTLRNLICSEEEFEPKKKVSIYATCSELYVSKKKFAVVNLPL